MRVSESLWNILLVGSEVSVIVMVEVPGVVSNDVWDDNGVSLNSILLLLLNKGSSGVGSSWGESSTVVGNPVDVISSSSVGLSAPLYLIGVIMLSFVPSVVSLVVWRDVGLAVLGWIGSLNLLSKGWHKSGWSLILNMVDVVSSGDVSLSAPFNLVALIVLVLGPCVLTLVVWVDIRVAVSNWVSDDILLSKSWSSDVQWVFSRVKIIRSYSLDVSFPLGFI